MKISTKIIIAVIIAALLATGTILLTKPRVSGAGYTPLQINVLDNLKYTETSTSSLAPELLAPASPSRQYAYIVNNSATSVYAYLSSVNLCLNNVGTTTIDSTWNMCNTSTTSGFANWTVATSTITTLRGIYLAANGGSYTIDQSNLFTGQIWVTSTAASLKVGMFYQQ